MGAAAESAPEDWAVGPQAACNDLRAVLAHSHPTNEDLFAGTPAEVRRNGREIVLDAVAITIAIDWRFVTALVLLALALLLK